MYSSVEITKHAAPKNARFDAARMSRIGRAATIGSAWLFPALRFFFTVRVRGGLLPRLCAAPGEEERQRALRSRSQPSATCATARAAHSLSANEPERAFDGRSGA